MRLAASSQPHQEGPEAATAATPEGPEVTHMCAELSGVSEKVHGVIVPNLLCYQCLGGGRADMIGKI